MAMARSARAMEAQSKPVQSATSSKRAHENEPGKARLMRHAWGQEMRPVCIHIIEAHRHGERVGFNRIDEFVEGADPSIPGALCDACYSEGVSLDEIKLICAGCWDAMGGDIVPEGNA
jgi:hypothetical protein